MDKKKRFMEAVAEKVGKRQPLMRRKGKPGMAVMIAIGAPKAAMKPTMKDEGEDEAMGESMDESTPKAKKIAMLQEKIASLKAELALLEDEDETEGEAMEAEDEESEDED